MTFQRGDFISFTWQNATMLGAIQHILVHDLLDEHYLFAVVQATTPIETVDAVVNAKIRTMGSDRHIVGLPAIHSKQIYAVPVVLDSENKLALGRRELSVGDKALVVDWEIGFL
jgi:hypothetical protein